MGNVRVLIFHIFQKYFQKAHLGFKNSICGMLSHAVSMDTEMYMFQLDSIVHGHYIDSITI